MSSLLFPDRVFNILELKAGSPTSDGLSSIQMELYAASFLSHFLKEIIRNKQLDVEEYRQRELTISEAFGLLWQNPKTGECFGRSGDDCLHGTAVICVLLDLYAQRKIDFRSRKNKKRGILSRLFSSKDPFRNHKVVVIDRRPTFTFLDDCLFNLILDADEEYTPVEWMGRSMSFPSHVLTAILRCLVNKGIFVLQMPEKGDNESIKFPTINHDPQKKLHDEIHMISVHGHVIDGFMGPLLKITRGYDHIRAGPTTLIEKQFNDENKAGLLNIDKHLFPLLFRPNKKKDRLCGKKKRSDSSDSLFDYHNRLRLY